MEGLRLLAAALDIDELLETVACRRSASTAYGRGGAGSMDHPGWAISLAELIKGAAAGQRQIRGVRHPG